MDSVEREISLLQVVCHISDLEHLSIRMKVLHIADHLDSEMKLLIGIQLNCFLTPGEG